MFYGIGLEFFDIDIGKKYKGFICQKLLNLFEFIYLIEFEEIFEISEFFFVVEILKYDVFFNYKGICCVGYVLYVGLFIVDIM